MKMKKSYYALTLVVFCLLASSVFAQDKSKEKYRKHEFCSKQNWSNGNRVSANDLRETKMPAGNTVKVDSKNGRITVKGENRSDILVRACVRAWAKSKSEAESVVKSIRVDTTTVIKAANVPEKSNWSVSYEIHVPKSTNLDLSARNGRITINSVNGQIKFETKNGRISLSDVAGNVKGMTRNGRVTVKLSGSRWQGNGLDVQTTNGRISLYMPANYAANVEAGTNNGRFSSDFAPLRISREGKKRRRGGPHKVNASINGGGAKIRLVTTNGRVKIGTSDE